MKKLDLISHFDHIYIEGFALCLFILSFYHMSFLILLMIYVIWQRHQLDFIKLCICIIWISVLFFITQDQKTDIDGDIRVVNITYRDDYRRITVKDGIYKYHIYDYQQYYEIGSIYRVHAEIIAYDRPSNPYDFNSELYFKSKGIHGYLNVIEKEKVKKQLSLYALRDQWIQNDYDVMTNTLIFGESLEDDHIKDAFKSLDIAFILNVSGLHVYVMMLWIKKICFDFNVIPRYQHMIIMICYAIILYMTAGDISILRLSVMYVLTTLSKIRDWRIASLDLHILGFMICMAIDIHLIYSYAFLMVFIIIISLQLIAYRFKAYHPLIRRYMIAMVIWLVLLPLQNHVSVLYIFISPIIVFIFCYVIYPLTWLSLLSSNFTYLLQRVSVIVVGFVDQLNNYQITVWFHQLNIYMIGVAYILLIAIAMSKTWIKKVTYILLFALCIYIPSISFVHFEEDVFYMVDVGQGDGMYIKIDQTHIVIDAFEHMTSFLSNHGINHIDYLILTHSDQDHTKEAHEIIEKFHVKQVVINAYDQNYDNYLEHVIRIKAGDYLNIADQHVIFYNPIMDYQNANNNSLVFKLKIGNYDFLFTGDIEEEAEHLIALTYADDLKSDVLKIAHHGSLTSTTGVFLDLVNPSKAIISVGKNNRFNFPSSEVIERLNSKHIDIYRTDIMGAIYYQQNRKREKWSSYL